MRKVGHITIEIDLNPDEDFHKVQEMADELQQIINSYGVVTTEYGKVFGKVIHYGILDKDAFNG